MANPPCGTEHPALRSIGTLPLVWTLLVVSPLAASCSGSSARPKPPSAPFTSEAQPAAEAPPQPPPARDTPRPPRTVVIAGDRAAEDEHPTSLLEASRRAKEKKQGAPPPSIVITNENLAEIAARGNLTIAKPAVKAEAGPASTLPEETPAADLAHNEEYWRSTARSLRERWKSSSEAVADLQVRTEALRYQFYSQEDTYVRDTRIKPAWDRALDQLEEARRESETAQSELEDFLEEGRRAGALPGWLREGIELEPEEKETTDGDLPEADVIEPVTLDEGDGRR